MILLVFKCFRVILMFVYCVFLAGNKDQGNVRIDAKKPKKWMLTVKQDRGYSLQRGPILLQRGYPEPKDQVYNSRVLAAAKILLATAKILLATVKTRFLDTLEHETLGYKRGRNNHFEGRREREWLELVFRERNTERIRFLEFSPKNWRIKAKNPCFI